MFEEFRSDCFSLTTCAMTSMESQLYKKYCILLVLVSMFALMI